VLLNIFSMHSKLLFSVSLLVVPLEPELSTLHIFLLRPISGWTNRNNQSSSIFIVGMAFWRAIMSRDRPVLPEIMFYQTNSLIIWDLYSSLELASQNAVCRCAHPRALMLLLEFWSSPIWATVMLQICKCRTSDSCLLQYDSRTTPSRYLYVMEV